MKDNCPVTGFDDKQKLQWPHAYKHLAGNAKLEKINLTNNELTILDNQINEFIKNQHITKELKIGEEELSITWKKSSKITSEAQNSLPLVRMNLV